MPDVFDVKTYYERVTTVDIGDVARELLAGRIVDEQRQTLFVDCPHHASVSHRSLQIWRDRQGWYCHGCGVGGDVLQLVEFVQSGVVTRGHSGAMPETHRQARDWLAARQGLPPLTHAEADEEQRAEIEKQHALTLRAWECLTAISDYYHAQLLDHPEVLAWLEKQYAFDASVVEAFLIGYASNDGLRAHLERLGFTLRDLYASGAFRPDQSHDDIAYPVFDQRVIFPYRAKGHVVYLIGRKTPWTPDTPYEQGKYKKLPVYDKHSRRYVAEGIDNGVLYNEDILATRPEQVIITEGITDCITLIRQGFTAISPVTVNIRAADWNRVLPKLRHAREIILCQDNEVSEAGWKGALRSAHQLTLASQQAKVAQLPLDAAQQEARRQLRDRFDLRPGDGRASLESRLAQATPQERTAAQLLLERAKQDVCGYFVAGHTAEEFARVLADAKSPVEYAIESIPDGELTTDLLRDIVSPILAQIAGLSTLEQTPLLKRLQGKLGKENIPLGDLRQAMREERQRRTSTVMPRPKTLSEQADSLPPMTDLGNAERLIKHHGNLLLYCQTSHEWLIWDGRRWANDHQNAARRYAHETARGILREEVVVSSDPDAREAWLKWQRTSESARASTNMLIQATAYLTASARDFDTDPWLLNVQNGTLDLRTGALHPHRQEDRLRKLAPVNYDPNALAPTWGKFLYRIFDGDLTLIEYIQRAVGYTLTGDISCQCLFFMFGELGQNGKTTFVETLLHLLGDYAQRAPTDLLMRKQVGATNVPNDLARLQGARLVVTSELDAGHRFSESRVKDLTGGDKITARFLYGEYFDFAPTHKLWMYGNFRPSVNPNDHGFWRRMHMIPFLIQIPPEERDGELKEKLRAESSGILSWAVRGCQLWREGEKRLEPPEAITEATQQYRSDMDRLAQFFGECCHIVAGAEVQAKRLYDRFVQWCEENHERPISNTAFGRELSTRGFASLKRRDAFYRQGITVRYED